MIRRLTETSSQHNENVLLSNVHPMQHMNAQQRDTPAPQMSNVENNVHSRRCEIYVVRTASWRMRARRQHWNSGGRGASYYITLWHKTVCGGVANFFPSTVTGQELLGAMHKRIVVSTNAGAAK